MSRIYAVKEDLVTTQGYVDFVNGAAALPASATAAIAYFTGLGLDIDTHKHALTVFDTLTREQLDAIATYLGVTLTEGDGKMDVVRDIETSLSSKYLEALTVASSAGTASGDTNIDVTDAGEGQLYYKLYTNDTAAIAGAPLYLDAVPSGWTAFATNADITSATGTGIGVVEANADGYVVGWGHSAVTAKA